MPSQESFIPPAYQQAYNYEHYNANQQMSSQYAVPVGNAREQATSDFDSTSSAAQQHGSSFTFAPPSVPSDIRAPQQYPFVPQQQQEPCDRRSELPATLTSSQSEYLPAMPQRPARMVELAPSALRCLSNFRSTSVRATGSLL